MFLVYISSLEKRLLKSFVYISVGSAVVTVLSVFRIVTSYRMYDVKMLSTVCEVFVVF